PSSALGWVSGRGPPVRLCPKSATASSISCSQPTIRSSNAPQFLPTNSIAASDAGYRPTTCNDHRRRSTARTLGVVEGARREPRGRRSLRRRRPGRDVLVAPSSADHQRSHRRKAAMKGCQDCRHVYITEKGNPRCHHPVSLKEWPDYLTGGVKTG